MDSHYRRKNKFLDLRRRKKTYITSHHISPCTFQELLGVPVMILSILGKRPRHSGEFLLEIVVFFFRNRWWMMMVYKAGNGKWMKMTIVKLENGKLPWKWGTYPAKSVYWAGIRIGIHRIRDLSCLAPRTWPMLLNWKYLVVQSRLSSWV